jgi:myo-inositol 2-dehydrogenase/D-chiro-inositol 1-dehydrogenase
MKKIHLESSASRRIARRVFVKCSYAAAAGATVLRAPFVITARAVPDDPIRVGVIGCGGRGTGAALNVLQSATKVIYPRTGYHTEDATEIATVRAGNVRVVALADMFPDRLATCRAQLRKVGTEIADDHCFLGFDAFSKLLTVPELNYVILATPPHFRPAHLRASVAAGKHVFMEKPVAVDGPGIRSVLESSDIAARKRLGIVAGTQRRHQASYVETVKRIHEGAIGAIVECRAHWNQGGLWVVERQPGWSDMEYQLRNWNYFTWLSGDHIVEQHVHNYDVIGWAVCDHPVKATSLGGRQSRTGRQFGHVYDHFATEYEYANGVRLFSQCRQIEGCSNNVGEAVVGTKGWSNCKDTIRTGSSEWRHEGLQTNPYEQEHVDLIQSIRAGNPLNEGRAVAESTLVGIMGRVSAYSGQTVTWDQVLNSKEDLSPSRYELGVLPESEVAIPGRYRFA